MDYRAYFSTDLVRNATTLANLANTAWQFKNRVHVNPNESSKISAIIRKQGVLKNALSLSNQCVRAIDTFNDSLDVSVAPLGHTHIIAAFIQNNAGVLSYCLNDQKNAVEIVMEGGADEDVLRAAAIMYRKNILVYAVDYGDANEENITVYQFFGNERLDFASDNSLCVFVKTKKGKDAKFTSLLVRAPARRLEFDFKASVKRTTFLCAAYTNVDGLSKPFPFPSGDTLNLTKTIICAEINALANQNLTHKQLYNGLLGKICTVVKPFLDPSINRGFIGRFSLPDHFMDQCTPPPVGSGLAPENFMILCPNQRAGNTFFRAVSSFFFRLPAYYKLAQSMMVFEILFNQERLIEHGKSLTRGFQFQDVASFLHGRLNDILKNEAFQPSQLEYFMLGSMLDASIVIVRPNGNYNSKVESSRMAFLQRHLGAAGMVFYDDSLRNPSIVLGRKCHLDDIHAGSGTSIFLVADTLSTSEMEVEEDPLQVSLDDACLYIKLQSFFADPLREIPGQSILILDDECANDVNRLFQMGNRAVTTCLGECLYTGLYPVVSITSLKIAQPLPEEFVGLRKHGFLKKLEEYIAMKSCTGRASLEDEPAVYECTLFESRRETTRLNDAFCQISKQAFNGIPGTITHFTPTSNDKFTIIRNIGPGTITLAFGDWAVTSCKIKHKLGKNMEDERVNDTMDTGIVAFHSFFEKTGVDFNIRAVEPGTAYCLSPSLGYFLAFAETANYLVMEVAGGVDSEFNSEVGETSHSPEQMDYIDEHEYGHGPEFTTRDQYGEELGGPIIVEDVKQVGMLSPLGTSRVQERPSGRYGLFHCKVCYKPFRFENRRNDHTSRCNVPDRPNLMVELLKQAL